MHDTVKQLTLTLGAQNTFFTPLSASEPSWPKADIADEEQLRYVI
jgi:hypothetical protein